MAKFTSFIVISCFIFIVVASSTSVYENVVSIKNSNIQLTYDNTLLLIEEQSKLVVSLSKDKDELIVKNNEVLLKLDELVVINNKLRDTVVDKDEVIRNLEKEIYFMRTVITVLRDEIDILKNEIRRLNIEITDLKITPLPPGGPE